ncbi:MULTISPECIES: sensor histidine kinase [Clostridium]|uniref:sensor histidine kinase n=1 Tax=Clostridium TaxID=1485 RepID=UPI001FA76442|nr:MULTISPECIES: HAMP domain-containing sensor histidine kinase [Clostridium]
MLKSDNGSKASWASWPISFTEKFSEKIIFNNGKPELSASGINELKKYKLSLQIIDENGNVVKSYNKIKGELVHYSPIQMVQLYKSGGDVKNHTIFVGSVKSNGTRWTYIIAFPMQVSKLTLYVDYNKASNFKFLILGVVLVIVIIIAVYGMKMNYSLLEVIASIKKLTSNSYVPMKKNGIYKDVYENLNLLDTKLKAAELERKKNQTLREEWISNISHDLKTPLSPIKGYAEMLADFNYEVNSKDAQKYGTIILRNANNLESIVKDLNFTYKLKNGKIPMKKENGNLVRLLKEVIIDILNTPKYEERNIEFKCTKDKVNFKFDNTLLRRGFTNLIYNSVVHNESNTILKVSIEEDDKIHINIEDNGKGMGEEEVSKLFERYYRGTNSEVKVQGSGLGMAIAKQIIEAHGGNIRVESKLNVGTSIKVEFAKET